MTRLRALLLATLLWVSAAHAEELKDAADEAEVQFTLGNEGYLRRDFRSALAHYFASHRLVANRNVLFNIARAYEQLGEYPEAFRYYSLFGRSGEVQALSADEAAALADARRRVQSKVALLDVSTNPPGATIYLDRKDLGGHGVTPRLLAVAPGRHSVIVELEGHSPAVLEDMLFEVGKTAPVSVTLEKILGRLDLRGSPAGATAVLDGPELVTVALPALAEVSPGRYRVTVSAPGHLPDTQEVVVVARGLTPLRVELRRQTGVLVVQADERDALVSIDGKPSGFTPAVIDGVAAGRHEIIVQAEGFKPWQTTVEVTPDERTLLDARLDASDEVSAASRTSEAASDAPASVSLVPKREIRAFGAQTVLDAVQGERGIFSADDESYAALGVRGFAPFGQYGNRILVQLDGHSLNDDWIGSSYITHDLLPDLEAIERVEIVRGPGSVLYGTGAFFGVINMVTSPDAPRHPVSANMAATSEGFLRLGGTAGLAFEGGSFWISGAGLYEQPSDFSWSAFASEANPEGLARDVGGQVGGGAVARLSWRDFGATAYFNERDKGIPTGSYGTVYGDDRFHFLDRRAFAELRYDPRVLPDLDLHARAYYDHYGYVGRLPTPMEDGGLLKETADTHWIGTELRAEGRPHATLRLTGGAGYEFHLRNKADGKDESGETYLDEDHPYHALSAHATVDYTPLELLSLTAGLRFDGWWHDALAADGADRFISSVSPRFAAILHPLASQTLKLLAGRSFRAPSIYELTYSDAATQVQSPDLEPETIWTYEVEFSQELPAELVATVGVFMNHIDGLVVSTGNQDAGDPLRYTNRSDTVWTLGVEAELARELVRGWMLGLQYSWQRTRAGDLGTDDELPGSPEHLASVKLVAPLSRPALLLATRLGVESGRLRRDGLSTDPLVGLDVVLSGEVPSAHLTYSLGIRNLIDWSGEIPVGEDLDGAALPTAGRSFFADLRFAW